jgi:hypothetical protein
LLESFSKIAGDTKAVTKKKEERKKEKGNEQMLGGHDTLFPSVLPIVCNGDMRSFQDRRTLDSVLTSISLAEEMNFT